MQFYFLPFNHQVFFNDLKNKNNLNQGGEKVERYLPLFLMALQN